MLLARRKLALPVLAGLALAAAGCGSNNKGKIEGKWKIVSAPGMEADEMKMMAALKLYAYMEFAPDGTLSIGFDSTAPGGQGIGGKGPGMKMLSCKYKLLSGDGVEFYDLPKDMQEKGGGLFGKNKDRARTKVKIQGDNMTMTDDDGQSGQMTRMK